ncbi:MAG: TonB-dependent receptor plug domain-containing protein [Treponema sp.]|jgi:hypothetical protein|nr:TonB-dependent receptor plug domain-containing protein [Treponema sp.]
MNKFLPAAVFLMALVPFVSLSARDVEITVEDADLGLPLEGAVIRSGDGREYICDEDGKALVSVPAGQPTVIQAAYPGYETGRIAVSPDADRFTLGLRLAGVMENRELVIEAERPGSGETKTGRSVGVSAREIAQSGEIGIIEDLMTAIKLLPGVGYAGAFNAQPSIRGGDPGDMTAALDGYYIENPYHWGGGFSIFDPRMVESARLSHGVFSSRYGHTISGLLEVSAKKPSPANAEFEMSVNTSAANFSLSLPLAGKGGDLFMGRVTYNAPFVWLAKQMVPAFPELEQIQRVSTAPYIRNGAVTGAYRFRPDLEIQATGFFGADGAGERYDNSSLENGLQSISDVYNDYNNFQGFITAGLSWNPRGDMLLKTSAGTGIHLMKIDGVNLYDISKHFSPEFNDRYAHLLAGFPGFDRAYRFTTERVYNEETSTANVQGRVDYDWDLGNGLLAAAGAQELFSRFIDTGNYRLLMETPFSSLSEADQEDLLRRNPFLAPLREYLIVHYPARYEPRVDNQLFSTSVYALAEYRSPGGRFGGEFGLRLDHFFLRGDGFSIPTAPVLNPRISADLNVLKDRGVFQSLDLSAGTGLFSSMNSMVTLAEERFDIPEGKPNRSWTSVLGGRLEFPDGLSLNVEGYYKYVFDRAYFPVETGIGEMKPLPRFDGEGRVWGVDLMLQKVQSRYWDGWLSYSLSWAKYRDPYGGDSSMGYSGGNRGDGWYFPSYHRFHNLNLVFNFRPVRRINIYVRFGLASGTQLSRITGPITSYPVYVLEQELFMEKFRRASVRDENNRTTPALPLDIKVSLLGKSKAGKVQYELYAAIEDTLALVYRVQGNTRFNSYTGKEDTSSNGASYGLPIPVPSFGFRVSY